MSVHVYPARSEQQTIGIENPNGVRSRCATCGFHGFDQPVGDDDVGHTRGPSAAIDQLGVANDKTTHRFILAAGAGQ